MSQPNQISGSVTGRVGGVNISVGGTIPIPGGGGSGSATPRTTTAGGTTPAQQGALGGAGLAIAAVAAFLLLGK